MQFNQYIGFPIRDIRWHVCEEINLKLWGNSYLRFFPVSVPEQFSPFDFRTAAERVAGEVHYGMRDNVPDFMIGDLFLNEMGTIEGAWV